MASHTRLHDRLLRLLRTTTLGDAPRAGARPRPSGAHTRREFLARTAATGALLSPLARTARAAGGPRVAIVGGGLAGLACADRLQSGGVLATIYEGQDSPGGRCRSLRGFFPGQVAERGGELIDNLHKTMLGYANRFGLEAEDVTKVDGEETFFIDGVAYDESAVIEEYRVLVPRMRADLKTSSGEPTFYSHTPGRRGSRPRGPRHVPRHAGR